MRRHLLFHKPFLNLLLNSCPWRPREPVEGLKWLTKKGVVGDKFPMHGYDPRRPFAIAQTVKEAQPEAPTGHGFGLMSSLAFAIASTALSLSLVAILSSFLWAPDSLFIPFLSTPITPPLSRPVRALLTPSARLARPPLLNGVPSYRLVVWQRHHLTFPTSPPPPLTITPALALKPLL
ncbi:hypothetical protein C8Q70DRAFT_1050283 [Cubamyces menziesii]|nr:hypothetical protein C8Q70DRAFT_1050283 [Cubamyces menziesii]